MSAESHASRTGTHLYNGESLLELSPKQPPFGCGLSHLCKDIGVLGSTEAVTHTELCQQWSEACQLSRHHIQPWRQIQWPTATNTFALLHAICKSHVNMPQKHCRCHSAACVITTRDDLDNSCYQLPLMHRQMPFVHRLPYGTANGSQRQELHSLHTDTSWLASSLCDVVPEGNMIGRYKARADQDTGLIL